MMSNSCCSFTDRARNRNMPRNMKFFIIVLFCAVVGIIVLAEIFLIHEREYFAMPGRFRPNERAYYEDDNIFRLISNIPKQPKETEIPPHPKNMTAKDGEWQIVSGTQATRFEYFIFSAFYDTREEQGIVRVIGITRNKHSQKVWCRLWYKDGNNDSSTANFNSKRLSVFVLAKVKVIPERWTFTFSSCFILCPFHKNLSAPQTVSIVSRVNYPPSNLVIVRNMNKDRDNSSFTKIPDSIAICVKPLHFNSNSAQQLLEFIELNKVMGIQHFTFYSQVIGKDVECILKDYISKGTATLLPWKIKISHKQFKIGNLFAALNDCLYRSMYRYSHVMFLGVDEFIIAKDNDTTQLDPLVNTRDIGFVTLTKKRTKAELDPPVERLKNICRPELVVMAVNQSLLDVMPLHTISYVSPDPSILPRYRDCPIGDVECVKTSVYKYREMLLTKFSYKFRDLQRQCNLSELITASNQRYVTSHK